MDKNVVAASAKILLYSWVAWVLLVFALPPYLTYAAAMQLSCRLQHGRWMDDDEAARWLADGWLHIEGWS